MVQTHDLSDRHAVPFNPVKGVSRPKIDSYEGKTPAISDAQVRALLTAPKGNGIKAKRDRAILSALFYHAMRRQELCTLKVKDLHERGGVKHFRVHGKGENLRYIPVHTGALGAIAEYLEVAGHGGNPNAPLFRPVRANAPGSTMSEFTDAEVPAD
jgi:site-specific recombinase XerD